MMDKLRKDIDAIDDELLILLNRRFEIVKKMILLKNERGASVEDKIREQEIISRLSKKDLIHKEVIKKIYKVLFNYAKNSIL